MGLQPTWGPGVCVSMATIGVSSHTTIEDHPLDTRREPSALESRTLEVLHCNAKGSRVFCGSFLRKGDVGRIQNLKDLKDPVVVIRADEKSFRGTEMSSGRTTFHTVEYDRFIRSQLVSRN